jgi:hypothetical protein
MKPKSVVIVFHAWDTDVCTLLLRNGESLKDACERVADGQKMRGARG